MDGGRVKSIGLCVVQRLPFVVNGLTDQTPIAQIHCANPWRCGRSAGQPAFYHIQEHPEENEEDGTHEEEHEESVYSAERHKLSYNKSRGKEDCQRLDKVAFRRRACVRGKVTAAEPYSVGCFGSLDTHLQSPLKRKHNLCGDDSGKSPSGWTV
ncbi:hypothetical protein ACO22_07322 [Paracoccidioides brasiliensis]|uniref:Uncharacterized protein n=1 Tax=Paracoccidioides brasiliensis TaxID=121759 RepID=A0A1D2J4Z3_PARBR|nr:hypothetical protein ACO22_07322 [Paracoccidioides brasiliensis]ODH51759.1 hypothetical protein GX48_02001 [Paracoccidioides brasiliensis]